MGISMQHMSRVSTSNTHIVVSKDAVQHDKNCGVGEQRFHLESMNYEKSSIDQKPLFVQ